MSFYLIPNKSLESLSILYHFKVGEIFPDKYIEAIAFILKWSEGSNLSVFLVKEEVLVALATVLLTWIPRVLGQRLGSPSN